MAFRSGDPLIASLAKNASLLAGACLVCLGLLPFAPTLAQTAPLFSATLTFDVGDDEIKSDARVTLDSVASRLLGQTYRTQITGYADNAFQTEEEDRRLSLRRAVAVRTYLIDKGVESSRIVVFARGETGENNIGVRINIFATP